MKHYRIAIALITLGISVFWSLRVRAANEAAQFQPIAAPHPVLLPVKTEIDAVIANGIPSSSAAGTSITAFVLTPVLFNGNVVISRGAELKGRMNHISVEGKIAKTDITFEVLTISGRSWTLQTLPVVVTIPVRTDTEILVDALRTLVAAGISAGIGASSKDQKLFKDTLIEGVRTSLPSKYAVPITATLARVLQM